MRGLKGRGLPALLLVAAACGDSPVEPDPDEPRIRTVLFHRQDTGQNLLLNSDGSAAGALDLPGDVNIPIGVTGPSQLMAVIHGEVLGLVRLDRPGEIDTVIAPLPAQVSLASFSDDARFVALVSFTSPRAVLVYDRANKSLDTLPYGDRDAVLPPVFSPDNQRIAVVTESLLSLFTSVIDRTTGQVSTEPFGFSRFLTVPIFGWPRWTDEGMRMAFVREGGEAPDTLLAVLVDPVDPGDFVNEQYRAVLSPVSDERPEVAFGPFSTYAFADDGDAIVLGVEPGTASGGGLRHALFMVTRGVDRVQLLLDDPEQVPVFPNFIN